MPSGCGGNTWNVILYNTLPHRCAQRPRSARHEISAAARPGALRVRLPSHPTSALRRRSIDMIAGTDPREIAITFAGSSCRVSDVGSFASHPTTTQSESRTDDAAIDDAMHCRKISRCVAIVYVESRPPQSCFARHSLSSSSRPRHCVAARFATTTRASRAWASACGASLTLRV